METAEQDLICQWRRIALEMRRSARSELGSLKPTAQRAQGDEIAELHRSLSAVLAHPDATTPDAIENLKHASTHLFDSVLDKLALNASAIAQLNAMRDEAIAARDRDKSNPSDQAKARRRAFNVGALAPLGSAEKSMRELQSLLITLASDALRGCGRALNIAFQTHNPLARAKELQRQYDSYDKRITSAEERCSVDDKKPSCFDSADETVAKFAAFLSASVEELDRLREQTNDHLENLGMLKTLLTTLNERYIERVGDRFSLASLGLNEASANQARDGVNAIRSRIRSIGWRRVTETRARLAHARAVDRYAKVNRLLLGNAWLTTGALYALFTLNGVIYVFLLTKWAGRHLYSTLGLDEFLAIGFGNDSVIGVGLCLFGIIVVYYLLLQRVLQSKRASTNTRTFPDVETSDLETFRARLADAPPTITQYPLLLLAVPTILVILSLPALAGYFRPEIDSFFGRTPLTIYREDGPRLIGWHFLSADRSMSNYYRKSGISLGNFDVVSVPTDKIRCIEDASIAPSECGVAPSPDTEKIVSTALQAFGDFLSTWQVHYSGDTFYWQTLITLILQGADPLPLPAFMEPFRRCTTNLLSPEPIRVSFDVDGTIPLNDDWIKQIRTLVDQAPHPVDLFMAGFASETGSSTKNLDLSRNRLFAVADRLPRWTKRPRRIEALPFGDLWAGGLAKQMHLRTSYPEESDNARSVLLYVCISAQETSPISLEATAAIDPAESIAH